MIKQLNIFFPVKFRSKRPTWQFEQKFYSEKMRFKIWGQWPRFSGIIRKPGPSRQPDNPNLYLNPKFIPFSKLSSFLLFFINISVWTEIRTNLTSQCVPWDPVNAKRSFCESQLLKNYSKAGGRFESDQKELLDLLSILVTVMAAALQSKYNLKLSL